MELNSLINSFGWTIINSLWQGLFILIVLSICMLLINPKYSRLRAMIAYASLVIIFAASIRTFIDLTEISTVTNSNIQITAAKVEYNFALLNDSNTVFTKSQNSLSTGIEIIQSIYKIANQNMDYIVVIWIAGIIILSLRMMGGYYYMQQIKTKNILPVDVKWTKMLSDLLIQLRIRKSVKMFESTVVKFPTVIDFIKPVILMPIGTLAEMSVSQVEMILAHELAHIKRADYLLNIIQSMIEILYFFNPAVWIISKIIRNEREYACDDIALSINSDSSVLARALISAHNHNESRPVIALSALGTKNSLLGRIKRMTKRNENQINYRRKAVLSSVLLLLLVTITFIACSSSVDNMNSQRNINSAAFNEPKSTALPYFTEKSNKLEDDSPIEKAELIDDLDKIERIENSKGKRNFNFHKNDVHWKGTLENGKVAELYKDGKRIPDNEIKTHEKMILDTLDEIDDALVDLEIDMDDLKEDFAKLKEDLKNIEIDVDFDELHNLDEHFNSEEFNHEMKELKESLKDLHLNFDDEWQHSLQEALKDTKNWREDFQHFQSQEFKKQIAELKDELSELKNHDFHFDFDFDNESFKESMKELKESMKDLKNNMKDLDIDLSDLKIDMKELKVEMKKLKGFLKDLKTDLIAEGYLDGNDHFDLELTETEMTVDGTKLPDNLHKRYLNLYKEHFGKDLEHDFKIH